MFILPIVSLGATYEYVSISQSVKTVNAPDATTALAVSASMDADPHSGVKLASGAPLGTPVSMTIQYYTYKYVDMNGNVRTVSASNENEAATLATDKHPNSGFQVVR